MYYLPRFDIRHSPASPAGENPARKSGVPVRVMERRLVASNSVFEVFFDCVEGPDGERVADYLSVLPKSFAAGSVGGVAVLPERGGRLGLIRVYRHPLGSYGWEVPRGFVDAGEDPVDAALRELAEEAGLTASRSSVHPLGVVAPEPGVIAARVRLFLVQSCRIDPRRAERELGHEGMQFFSPEEVDALIRREEIQDPFTMVAYFAFARRADRRGQP